MNLTRRYTTLSIALVTLLSACNKDLLPNSGTTLTPTQQVIQDDCPIASPAFLLGSSHLLNRITTTKTLKVVAIGSSSTEGIIGARNASLNYVGQLTTRLNKAFPGINVTVLNKGMGGQILSKIWERWATDVQQQQPDVVILQTGINDAMQNVNQSDFTNILKQVEADSKQRGYQLILMGNQYLGKDSLTRVPQVENFNTIIQKIATDNNTVYINRYNFLRDLIEKAGRTQEELYYTDILHPSEVGYQLLAICVARQGFGIDSAEEPISSVQLQPQQ